MTTSTHRILITGSRTWSDIDLIRGTILGMIASRGWQADPVMIVHGDCPDGADALTKAWVKGLRSLLIDEESNPADWKKNPRSAGHIRNAAMVSKGAELCIAFAMPCRKVNCSKSKRPHLTHGTDDCLKKARAAHIETIMIRGDM